MMVAAAAAAAAVSSGSEGPSSPQSFPLDTDAANGFLLGIPLLSLTEETVPAQVAGANLSRQVSFESVFGGSGGSQGGLDVGLVRAISCPESFALDVARAQRFLLSLQAEMVVMDDAMAEPRKDISGAVGPSSLTVAMAAAVGSIAEVPGHRSEEPPEMRLLTFVGGWRSSADLMRLAPGLIRKGLFGGRVILSVGRAAVCVSSTLPCVAEIPSAGGLEVRRPIAAPPSGWRSWMPLARCRRRRNPEDDMPGTSYAGHLVPSDQSNYDPNFLDDQSLRQGKHHTVLRLESYQISVIPFLRPRRLKEELNDQFHANHPWLHRSITLSKLRNLRKDLLDITLVIPELDLSTVAIAWVYFEKLVLGDCVRKGNRKLLAGACLVLAFKFYQHGERAEVQRLAACIRRLDRKDQLDQDSLRSAELQVFVWLKFALHVDRSAVLPHLHRMLRETGTAAAEYYGADVDRLFGQEPRPADFASGLDEELPAECEDSPPKAGSFLMVGGGLAPG